jgi:restriction endonuclease S subunit
VEVKIPLSPLEVQREIVAEIEGYQQEIKNYELEITKCREKIAKAINKIWRADED